MDYEKLCKGVMDIDPDIRFAIVLSKYGERIAGGYRENISSLLSPAEINMSLFYASQRWDTRIKFSHRIGAPEFSMTQYKQVKQFTMPINEQSLLLVSTETNADHAKIIDQVLNFIKNNQT